MPVQLDSARLITVGRTEPSPKWHIAAQSHSNHELIVVLRGVTRVYLSGSEITGTAGDLLFYRSGEVHEEWSDSRDPVETLFVAFELDDPGPHYHGLEHDVDGRIRHLARWLYEEWPRHAIGTAALCRALFHSVLLEWERLHQHSSEPPLVASTRAFIRERVDSHIDLEMLAEASGLSRYYFVRKYKRLTGRTPMDDVRAERVRHAQHLIANTTLPMKDIAGRCGFADEYHLSHLVRRYLDATPTEIRSSMR